MLNFLPAVYNHYFRMVYSRAPESHYTCVYTSLTQRKSQS